MEDEKVYAFLNEPSRTSVYSIVLENLKTVGRTTFIHRAVVVGEHDFGLSWQYGIEEIFRGIINDINEDYCEEKLTGFLVCYPQYFCHITEGAEHAQIKYITTLVSKYRNQIGRIKLLCPFHHIYKRMIDTWRPITGNPPRLMQKIKRDCNIPETYHYVRTCVHKLFKLCGFMKYHEDESFYMDDSPSRAIPGSLESRQTEATSNLFVLMSPKSNVSLHSSITMGQISTGPETKWRTFLPEYGLISFLLDSPFIEDLREKLYMLYEVPSYDTVEERTWPYPMDFLPNKSLMATPNDPVIDLPKN